MYILYGNVRNPIPNGWLMLVIHYPMVSQDNSNNNTVTIE